MSSNDNPNRREMIGAIATTTLAAGLPAAGSPQESRSGDMIYRQFRKTGIKVSAIGLGGSHIGNPKDENEGVRIVRTAIDRGITFMDNCWDYHDGKSEVVMGKALRDGYRQKVFLMTKFDGRTKAATARQIAGLGRHGDILLALSTSGRSPNILAALRVAHEHGLITIGFTGTKGAAMGVACDHLLVAPSDDTPVIQQIHLAVAHGICDEVEQALMHK